MNKIRNYFRESYHELVYKVSWPTWQELQSSTMVVLIATVVVTFMVWGMDAASNFVLTHYYEIFNKTR
ncbi:MAG TPA: preprotein translocase subunit SecE [Chitinophaga sp.]|uniref:preprotein translocase subunit SecE n=1 Tax=Chitinophaga sp. TaxID=1869181 RepID=UPI002BE3E32B|nr:preprotein translocase subunit SecE [Chitinophaga sp.]HVI47397.1 preprotein translocase subunit SecE [Chitinophaga sp.]